MFTLKKKLTLNSVGHFDCVNVIITRLGVHL